MSGLTTERKTGGNNVYLKVMNGHLVQNVKEGTEGAVERINKEKKKVWELLYTGLTALITSVSIVDGDKYGKQLEIKAKTDSQNFVIQTPASGGYAFGFLSRMVNLDFTQETEIRPYAIFDKEKNKTNHVIVLYQGVDEKGKSIKIESAFTKENPNGLPELDVVVNAKNEPVLKNGKQQFDDSARVEFFENVIYGEGGVNEVLVGLYGSAEEVAKNENKDSFLSENDVEEAIEEEATADEEEATADEEEAEELPVKKAPVKAAVINRSTASKVAAKDVSTKKAAVKQPAKKAPVKVQAKKKK